MTIQVIAIHSTTKKTYSNKSIKYSTKIGINVFFWDKKLTKRKENKNQLKTSLCDTSLAGHQLAGAEVNPLVTTKTHAKSQNLQLLL